VTDDFGGQRIDMVRVTNNGEVFTDRYDGVPYVLIKGQTKSLPLAVANHIFGYKPGVDQRTMFLHTCKRQGWNTPKHVVEEADGTTLAEKLFANLKIEPVVYKVVEDLPDLKKPIPADPQIITRADPTPARKGV
jgi:hypothetical protein